MGKASRQMKKKQKLQSGQKSTQIHEMEFTLFLIQITIHIQIHQVI